MLPYINIFGLKIPAYALMVLLGALVSAAIVAYRRRSAAFPASDLWLSCLLAGFGAFLGAKLLFFITAGADIVKLWGQFSDKKFLMYNLVGSGFVFYGGLIGGLIMLKVYAASFEVSFSELLYLLVPTIPLVHAFGRVGCFMAGCCYGQENHRFGLCFPNSLGGPRDIPLLPIQLLEAGILVLIFAVLIIRSRQVKNGLRLLGLYLVLYPPVRFVLEFFRGDPGRGFCFSFSTSQWISLILFPIGLILLKRQQKALPDPYI